MGLLTLVNMRPRNSIRVVWRILCRILCRRWRRKSKLPIRFGYKYLYERWREGLAVSQLKRREGVCKVTCHGVQTPAASFARAELAVALFETKSFPPSQSVLQNCADFLKQITVFYIPSLIIHHLPPFNNIMADPVSAAAGFVGIIVPALHGARLLRRDIENLVDAPKAVGSLKEDLRSVDLAIEGLKAVKPAEWESLGQAVVEQSKVAVRTCESACDAFRSDLSRWTKHSEDGKLSLRDRFNVGFFQEQKIKSLSGQLQNCRSTINTAASTATLYAEFHLPIPC